MVFVNASRNSLRDHFTSLINEAAVGTDGTAESTSDTSIGSEVLAKDEGSGDLTENTPSDGEATYEFTIGLSEANGNTLREVVLRDTGNSTMHVRITHSGITKDNSFTLSYTIIATWENSGSS